MFAVCLSTKSRVRAPSPQPFFNYHPRLNDKENFRTAAM